MSLKTWAMMGIALLSVAPYCVAQTAADAETSKDMQFLSEETIKAMKEFNEPKTIDIFKVRDELKAQIDKSPFDAWVATSRIEGLVSIGNAYINMRGGISSDPKEERYLQLGNTLAYALRQSSHNYSYLDNYFGRKYQGYNERLSQVPSITGRNTYQEVSVINQRRAQVVNDYQTDLATINYAQNQRIIEQNDQIIKLLQKMADK